MAEFLTIFEISSGLWNFSIILSVTEKLYHLLSIDMSIEKYSSGNPIYQIYFILYSKYSALDHFR